jgi:hypothetical protein
MLWLTTGLLFLGKALGASGFLDFLELLELSGKLSAYVGHAILLELHEGAVIIMATENINNHKAFSIIVFLRASEDKSCY